MKKELSPPTLEQLERELKRVKYKKNYFKTLWSTISVLVVVAAFSILAATKFIPVLKIYGLSMTPTLESGDIVLSVRTDDFETGDIVSFYYNNEILVKRIIAKPGDWVDIQEDGSVSVNGKELEEPYLKEKSLGNCDITLPCQVPDGRWFVLGDHRAASVDSRSAQVGFVAQEQIVGKIVLRIWPLRRIGLLR